MEKEAFTRECEDLFYELLLERNECDPVFQDAVGSAVLGGGILLGQIVLALYNCDQELAINNFGNFVCEIAYINNGRMVFEDECVQEIASKDPELQPILKDVVSRHIARLEAELSYPRDLQDILDEFAYNARINNEMLSGLKVFEQCKVDFWYEGYLKYGVIAEILGQPPLYFNV